MNLSARESALGAEKAPSVLANCGVLRMEHFHLLSRGKQSTGLFSFRSPSNPLNRTGQIQTGIPMKGIPVCMELMRGFEPLTY